MTLFRQLVTANRGVVTIQSEEPAVVNHFSNPNNYADVVLDMFNNDRFYDEFFQGWRDLKILDIGGNIGLFSLYAQDIASDIWTLEPTPSHFNILQTLTKDFSNIHPLNIALHNRDETIDFYISDDNSTMNSTVNQYGKKIAVQARTIATVMDDIGVDTSRDSIELCHV